MNEVCLAVEAFMTNYLRDREWFIVEAIDDLDDWEDESIRPLDLAMVHYSEEFNQILAMLSCAEPLEAKRLPVRLWVDGCTRALREGLPGAAEHFTLKCGDVDRIGPWKSYRRSWPE